MKHRGFTLTEMLAAMAVIALLIALVVPAFNHTLRASKITTTGQAMVDELNFARQTAMSRNQVVEVRCYKLPDHGAGTSATPTVYRGLQTFLVQGGAVSPLSRPTVFSAPVIISSGTAESPFLNSSAHAEQTSSQKLPEYGDNYRYRSFRFSPNGSTDLSTSENSVTLVLQNDKPLTEGANFFTVQVNSLNGSIRSFRP